MKNKVQVVITTPNQEILLLQMNERRGSYWQNVTGGVEENEEFHYAAVREVQEETGLAGDNIKKLNPLFLEFSFVDQYQNKVLEKCFHLEVVNQWEIKLDPNEHDHFKWMPIHQVTAKDVHYESNYNAIIEARKLIG